MKRLVAASIALGFMAWATVGANAETSTYTQINLAACAQAPLDPDDPLASGEWVCPGYQGIPVLVGEGDLRFFVSFGVGAKSEPAWSQTLPPFNTINSTLEWRLDDLGQPFATVLRYFADRGDGRTQQILVVTRLGVGSVCHVAYVDASANGNANLLAQQAADALARHFPCGDDYAHWFGDGGF